MQEHRKGLYLELVLAGKLNEHLHQIDEECNQMMDRLVEQMKEKHGRDGRTEDAGSDGMGRGNE